MINISYLKKHIKGKILINEPLKNHTTFRIGGAADIMIIPEDVESLINIIKIANDNNIAWFVMGNGSNILVSDEGYRGIIIKICKAINYIKIEGNKIVAGAGVILPYLSVYAAKNGLGSLEHLAGIPGTLGGAVVMNAGSCKEEIGNVVEEVKIINSEGEIETLSKEDLKFGYRYSSLQNGSKIVLEVKLKLKKENPDVIKDRIRKILKKRREKFPLKYPNAGSIFKKPKDAYAGELIEKAGCKGLKVGDAKVSEKHANFIINLGNAKAKDVLFLLKKVRKRVYDKFGILLEPEITFLGFKDKNENNVLYS